MKKKFLSLMLAICLIIPCALILTACGFETDVKYVIKNVEIVWASEDEKNAILNEADKTEAELKAQYSTTNAYITFKEDGTLTSGTTDENTSTFYYTKDGNYIKVYSDEAKETLVIELEIDGDKIVQKSNPDEDYQTYIKITYEKQ